MKNERVIERWKEGRVGNALHLSTDGKNLYSYALLIGFTGRDGLKYVKNYTAHKDTDCFGNVTKHKFHSMTTSKHVTMARVEGYSVSAGKEEV